VEFTGVARALSLLLFGALLIFLIGSIFTGIAIAALAFYVWMQAGEIDGLEARLQRLEEERQRVTAPSL